MNIQQFNELRSQQEKDELSNFKYKYKHANGIPTLYHLTINLIKRNLTSIHDIGNIPYHLLEPVLVKMSAKQLNELEEKSPQLTPYSDKIWKSLIIKDFSNRPVDVKHQLHQSTMPYKSLYNRYFKEREDYRKDSTKRLKKLNDSLEKQKAKNKIIAVDDVLSDPTIKRRFDYGSNRGHRQYSSFNKNSILDKARRETQYRSAIFGKQKPYDPYDAFKIRPPRVQSTRPFSRIATKHPTTPLSSDIRENYQLPLKNHTRSYEYKPPDPIAKASEVKHVPKKIEKEKTEKAKVEKLPSQSPSIFIQRKRPIKSPEPKKKREKLDETPSKIKPLKSSIFS